MRAKLHGLYVITPAIDHAQGGQQHLQNQQPQRNMHHDVELALKGGARVVQYRNKFPDNAKRREQAAGLLALCNLYGAVFIVNDDVELAATIQAHGVHLGAGDLPLTEARRRLGRGALLGASCYNRLELALNAQQQGADYVAFGRFFPSHTKPQAVQADLELLRLAKHELALPIVAIGGITAQNGGQLIAAGADMLAVVDGVFGQEDIYKAARQLAACFL